MTYNEWRDELKSNLLCVSESERRRVLDYYAEAYADRRDAGFSEREIIEDFGAPYDAAQRILSENSDGYYNDVPQSYESSRGERRREERELREERRREEREAREREREEREREREARRFERTNYGNANESSRDGEFRRTPSEEDGRGDNTWLFVLLCIIFAIPIFIVIMCMVSVTVVLCVAPIGVLVSGVASVGAGVGGLFTDVTNGVMGIGMGLIVFGVSLILIPLCFLLVKWMWKLFHMFFAWLRRLFGGRARGVRKEEVL